MAFKLTVVVRDDLTPGQQACQAVHAAQQYAVDHPERFGSWYRDSNTIALLAVANEGALF